MTGHCPGREHAVVIGASVGGLVAARALTDGFERVTVLDRDDLPDEAPEMAAPRGGVPQGRHVHILLAVGSTALEQLFPGLTHEIAASGAHVGDLDRGWCCLNGHRMARARLGQDAFAATRPFTEAHVRRRVRRHPAITLRHGMEVRGLEATDAGRRIGGVRVAPRGSDPAETTEDVLAADLVLDCTGRRSQTPQWLRDLGYAEPEVDELQVDVAYSTIVYRMSPGGLDQDRFLLIGPTPDGPRGAAALKVEGDRWIVTLFGMGGERPPRDPGQFVDFARRLPIPDLHEALREGEPLSRTASFRFPANLRRRYEEMDRFPAGLLVAGDAVASFNPIYGQGMSVAALEALTLRRLLGDGVPTPKRWFAAIAPTVDVAWDLATGADLAVRSIDGHRTLTTRLLGAYIGRLHAASVADPALTRAFFRVASLLDPPARLLGPRTLLRVLRGNLRRQPR